MERWYRDLRAVGVMEGACWSDASTSRPEEVPATGRPGPPGRDEHAAPDLAQVRPRRARVPQGARHARGDDRRALGVRRGRGRRRGRRTPRRARADDDGAGQERRQPRLGACPSPRCAGATSACCCRCPARASATPRSPRSPTTSSPSASPASGPAMAITEPGTGSDSANIRTTAVLDGDEYVLNGEKIFVTSGERADCVVVWATLDKEPRPGRDQVVRGREGHAGHAASSGSSTSSASAPPTPRRSSSRLPGARPRTCSARRRSTPSRASPARWRPSTTPGRWSRRWRSGCARASLDLTRELLEQAGVEVDYDRPAQTQSAAAATFLQMEADWEAAHLLTLQAAWMADNRKPNSLEASMAKAKAGRVGSDITLGCVELCRLARLQRGRAAGEVGPRLQDPRHLRGHPADPAADRGPPRARADERRAEVAPDHQPQTTPRGADRSGGRQHRCRPRPPVPRVRVSPSSPPRSRSRPRWACAAAASRPARTSPRASASPSSQATCGPPSSRAPSSPPWARRPPA